MADRSAGRPALRRLAGWDRAIIALLVVFLLVAAVTVDNFATGRNLSFLVLDLAPILLIALPMTLVVVTGEIDLSVASTLGLSSAAMGAMWQGGLPIETIRSEERRVGKECRSRWSPYH